MKTAKQVNDALMSGLFRASTYRDRKNDYKRSKDRQQLRKQMRKGGDHE